MKLDIPERFQETIYVCVYSDPSDILYGTIVTRTNEPSEDSGLLLLGQTDVDIPLSVDGTLDKQVSQMRRAKQRNIDEATEKASQIDEATEKASQIDEAIESLLAIEYKEQTK